MNTSCPLCGEQKHTILYNQIVPAYDADLVSCDRCDHYYTFIKKEVNTDELYSDEVYKVVENKNSIFDKILSFEYKRVIKNINKLKPTKGSLLDFGSGKGKFGSLAKEDGWMVKCIETSTDRAEYARKNYQLDVFSGFYSTGNVFNMNFDVLTLFHVLEHLSVPTPLLQELIKGNLKEDALFILEVPNFKSWQSGIAKRNWMHLDIPRHVNHFTPARLESFARELNFIPVKKSFLSFHLGILGMLDSLLKLFGYRRNLIFELKNKRTFSLLLKILVLLPVAIILELVATAFGKGGIIRLYLKKA
ncbi:class I SAM-dependent methyltransferase [Paraflavitalea soli]|uniref:Class I SAM-dependent methyltransferase n=1 Tax=Paraflavitalea soli TaxID=2315862 RepID=A0A3B7MSG7_9BACT|nr:class I SAM-dependent methyltransferase [Paraflavitalea soli]AXY77484.1 class I SAM-dependent methyltransferase [Paraflavitalea soli]